MPKSTLVKRVSPLPIDNAGSAMQVLDPETKNTMIVTATAADTVYLSNMLSYPAVVRLASDKDGFFGTGEETTNNTASSPIFEKTYQDIYLPAFSKISFKSATAGAKLYITPTKEA